MAYPLSQFVSAGKLKKRTEFCGVFLFGLMTLQTVAHIHIQLLLSINTEEEEEGDASGCADSLVECHREIHTHLPTQTHEILIPAKIFVPHTN